MTGRGCAGSLIEKDGKDLETELFNAGIRPTSWFQETSEKPIPAGEWPLIRYVTDWGSRCYRRRDRGGGSNPFVLQSVVTKRSSGKGP
jgi:hypothetical protein